MNKRDFDVIIAGGGAAGISAALWCDELGLDALLLESRPELGGQLLSTYNPIENYLGFEARNGRELRDVFIGQMDKRNFICRFNSKIVEADPEAKKIVLSGGDTFSSRALIIATGVRRKKLQVKGEEEFRGKGILVSGKLDKGLANDKTVLIVGGGDAAFENTEILSETSSKIILVHRREEFSARKEFVGKAYMNPKVEVMTNTIVKKITGDQRVRQVWIEGRDGETTSLDVDLVLVRICVEPNSEFLKNRLILDNKGYVKIDQNCETSAAKVFAVGDVANPFSPTVNTAVGTAATAVKSLFFQFKKAEYYTSI